MKALNYLTKPIGLALLAATLMSASPSSMNLGSTSLASTSRQGVTSTNINDRSGNVIDTADIRYTATGREKIEGDFVNGEFISRNTGTYEVNVTFSSDKFCGTCLSPLTVQESDVRNLDTIVQQYIERNSSQIASLYNQKQREDREAETHQAALERLRARAENCSIKITDEANLTFVRLSGSEHLEERLECKAEKFQTRMETLESERDLSDREYRNLEMREFRKAFGSDIDEVVRSGDLDRADILEGLAADMESEQIGNYLETSARIARDNNYVVESATTLADQNANPQDKLIAQSGLLQMQQGYSQQPMGNSGRTQAIVEYRNELLRQINTAMTNPSSLLSSDSSVITSGSSSRTLNAQRGLIMDGANIPRPGVSGSSNTTTGNRLLNRTSTVPTQNLPGMTTSQVGFPQQQNLGGIPRPSGF